MKTLALFLILLGTSAQAAECLSYSGTVKLKGVLSKHTFAEQPNYESIKKGDAASTYFFVVPAKPICVSAGEDKDGLEPSESSIERVQLVFTGDAKSAYDSLRPYLGREVVCVGSFFHSISGHHHSSVLLSKAKCSRAQQAIPSDRPKAGSG